MAASFGVHVGNTTISLAINRDGKVDVVANDAGDRATPAMVAYQNEEKLVGLPAKQGLIRNAANTLYHAKSLLQAGCDDAKIKRIVEKATSKIVTTESGGVFEVTVNDKKRQVKPQDVMQLLYMKMLNIADSQQGSSSSHDCVIAVPLHFTEDQIKVMNEAATKAGFNVLRVIPEPAAAALAYGIAQEKPHKTCYCVVYRVGGATMDVTLLRACEGMYSVTGHVTDDAVGGDLCTDLLVDFFAIDYKKFFKSEVRENRRALMKLHSAAENCKHVLSTLSTSQCFVESLYDGMDFTSNITRARFDSLIQSIQQQYLGPLETLLNNANLKAPDIDKVILVGGSTKAPKFQQLLSEYFPNAEVLNSIASDEVIAMGASIQAALVDSNKTQNGLGQAIQLDVLTKGLYIKLLGADDGAEYLCLVPEGTPVPVLRQHRVTTPSTHHGGLVVEVWEGDKSSQHNADTAALIAKIVLREATPGGEVQVSLEVTSEGTVRMLVTDKKTGSSESLTVSAES